MTITRKALVADSLPGGIPSPAAPLITGTLSRLGLRPVRVPVADDPGFLSVTEPVVLAVKCTDEVAAVRAIEAWCRVAGPREITTDVTDCDYVLDLADITSAEDVRPEWLAGVRRLGLVPDAPAAVVDEIVRALRSLSTATRPALAPA
ncbi:hypothetical protein [Symbioplanes lichenis]|uniref:hypothetical protein n=1 Tax=Symbioplanes lichenis TaxID=1629072 RepID=UPI002738A828|nr:hypothetical protein [Actinoplanes lichenis]